MDLWSPCPGPAGRRKLCVLRRSWGSGAPPTPCPHSSLTFIADEPGPAVGAVTATQAGEAGPPVPAVSAGQAAIWAKGIVQADWGTQRERGLRAWPLALDPAQHQAGEGAQGTSSGCEGPTWVSRDVGPRWGTGKGSKQRASGPIPGSAPGALGKLTKQLGLSAPWSNEALTGALPHTQDRRVGSSRAEGALVEKPWGRATSHQTSLAVCVRPAPPPSRPRRGHLGRGGAARPGAPLCAGGAAPGAGGHPGPPRASPGLGGAQRALSPCRPPGLPGLGFPAPQCPEAAPGLSPTPGPLLTRATPDPTSQDRGGSGL